MAQERTKLTVTEIGENKSLTRGGSLQKFKAKTPDGKELQYFTFSAKIIPMVKTGAVLDVDLDTTEKNTDQGTFIDRKVTQLYQDGQPVAGQKGNWQPQRDNTASIEMQTAAKIGGELLVAKVIDTQSELGRATMAWCLARLGKAELKAETKSEIKSEDDFDRTFGQPKSETFADSKHFLDWVYKEYSLTGSQIATYPAVLKAFNGKNFSVAAEELRKEIAKVRAK